MMKGCVGVMSRLILIALSWAVVVQVVTLQSIAVYLVDFGYILVYCLIDCSWNSSEIRRHTCVFEHWIPYPCLLSWPYNTSCQDGYVTEGNAHCIRQRRFGAFMEKWSWWLKWPKQTGQINAHSIEKIRFIVDLEKYYCSTGK